MRVSLVNLLVAFLIVICCNNILQAAETRGLRVVAKDTASGQTSEVILYNKSYAVIIGIDRYLNLPPDRQLTYAVNDAKGVEAAIRKNYRFDKVFTLYNQDATKDRIMELLTEELPAQMGEEDALFLFWAGHGNQEKGAQGKEIGYLIPYDGTTDKIRKNLTMTELRDTISAKLPAKHVFYVMDACYSGLLTTRAVDKKSRRDLSYLKEITKETARQVLTAGGKGEEVLDGGPKGHSVFTGRLIEILEAQGDFITANEIQSIIREKVYGDARGRGHSQTPSFGALSGSGDYVFIPSIEQKLVDNRAEIEKLEKEKSEMERLEAAAIKSGQDTQRREAERKKLAAEAKLKIEELKQQQLQDEQKRAELARQEQARFLTDQQKQQDELGRKKQEDSARLAQLKAEIEKKKKYSTVASGASLEAAVAEIKRLSAEIDGIEATYTAERQAAANRIETRYNTLITDIKKQKEQATLSKIERDEFETEADFQERQRKGTSSIDDRIEILEKQKNQETEEMRRKLAQEQTVQTSKLREELKILSDKEFSVDPSMLVLDIGKYDADNQRFPVEIRSKTGAVVKVAMNGTISLPKDTARQFKQQFTSGLVRPEISVKPAGEPARIALANDAENYLMTLENGEFLTLSEKKRRDDLAREEKGLGIYTESKSGLMWTRNGNIAGKEMNWNEAMSWVKQLNFAGYSDWRLPTIDELEGFSKSVDLSPSKWLNSNGFNNVQSNLYWTSTPYANRPNDAWVVGMGGGGASNGHKVGSHCYVWPVRAGQ